MPSKTKYRNSQGLIRKEKISTKLKRALAKHNKEKSLKLIDEYCKDLENCIKTGGKIKNTLHLDNFISLKILV